MPLMFIGMIVMRLQIAVKSDSKYGKFQS